MEDQGAQNLMDALHYTPGVSLESYNANAFFDAVKIRGFAAPRYLDGLRLPNDSAAFAVPRIEIFGLERIEVLKGPSSGLYGQSDPGGLINMVSKRPLATPHFLFEGTAGSFSRIQGAFDFGGPIDKDGQFLYRVVGLGRDSDSQTNFVQDNELFIAPSFTWRPTQDTSFTILSQYQKISNDGYQQYVPGEVTLQSQYGRIPYNRYLGEPGHDHYTLEQAAIGYAFEHRFNNVFQFRQNLRYMEVTNNMDAMRGDAFVAPSTFLRTPIYTDAKANNLTLDNQLQADFSTGFLTHKVLVGLDYQNMRSSNDSRYTAPIMPINVFNPVYGATPFPPYGSLLRVIDVSAKQEQLGVYAQDQIKLDRWTLTLTGRNDWATSDIVSENGMFPPPGKYARSDTAATGRVGLNYLFDFGLSPYANYSTSFVPNGGASAEGVTFKPTTGEGKEIGIKFMPVGSNLMFTAAWFDIEQKDILTSNPLAPFYYVQTDAARVKGYELELRGNITREFEVVAGYSNLDPRITKSIVGNVGNYLPNVNLEQASFWGKYTWYEGPLAGLGLGGGVRYVGENYGDASNLIYIPSHTLFDAAISYDFAYASPDLKGWKAQVTAINLANTYYVTSCQGALPYCGLGTARTVLGSLKYSWNEGARR